METGIRAKYAILLKYRTMVIIPPANCVCGRVFCFHVVRTNEQTNERKCVRNVLLP